MNTDRRNWTERRRERERDMSAKMQIKTVFCNTVLGVCVYFFFGHERTCVFSVFFMFVSVLSVRDLSQDINV